MLKILTAAQIKELDKATIESEQIASIDLMERASLAFVKWFVRTFNYRQHVGIFSGPGNNGGDGLAVARLLKERRYNVTLWTVTGGSAGTSDFKANLQRLPGIVPNEIGQKPNDSIFDGIDVLIDALFGSGLTRPLDGIFADVVNLMNVSRASRIAIDIPSGLMPDGHSTGVIFKADHTITFQLPKLAFLLPENSGYVGRWELADIGLSRTHISKETTSNFFVTGEWAHAQMPLRKKFAHKGNFGNALVIAGSYGKMGACVLSTRAALRTGAGLVTARIPGCGYGIIQAAVPEAMASVDDAESYVTGAPGLDQFDCIGIGPGLGTSKETSRAVKQVLNSGKPVVIDADALNLLSRNASLMKLLHRQAILTPHPGEFRRLAGDWSDDFERLELQRKLAAQTGATVVLKGAHTSVASPDGQVFFNSTGNPGMATGGSGDVLTGIVTGLLAQGIDTTTAAILGVYLHGTAGDLAFARSGGSPLIASDIVDMIPGAFKSSFL